MTTSEIRRCPFMAPLVYRIYDAGVEKARLDLTRQAHWENSRTSRWPVHSKAGRPVQLLCQVNALMSKIGSCLQPFLSCLHKAYHDILSLCCNCVF